MLVNTRNKFYYQAFCLNIASEIEIPYFMSIEEPVDIQVHIELGKVPQGIENVIFRNHECTASQNEILISKEVASFYVKNGMLIKVEKHTDSQDDIIRVYLTGSIMGLLLAQRKLIPIHGSSVIINNKGVIFTGKSGMGKSTLCSLYIKKGCFYLSDDISVISMDGSTPLVLPAYPIQRLYKDTASLLGYNTRKVGLSIDHDKYVIRQQNGFAVFPAPLSALFELNKHAEKHVEASEVVGSLKLKYLLENLYFSDILIGIGLANELMNGLSVIARTIPYNQLFRPEKKIVFHKLMSKIEELIP